MNLRIKRAVILLAAVCAVGLTLSLGQWQLHRAAEKIALQSAMDDQATKAPLEAFALRTSNDVPALVYQRVHLRGSWLPKASVYLDNRQMADKVGFFVLTPLLLEGGGAVLVQRGWAPRNFENRNALPAVQTPDGIVDLEGRIAPPPSKLFELGTAVAGTIRQNLDLVQFQSETGLPLMPVTVLQTGPASEGLLREWPAVNLGVAKHYGYAFQWFAIASLVAVLTLWFQFIRPFYQRIRERDNHA